MTPPPVFDDRNFSGKPSMATSQSITCVSSSVQAGLVDQSIPCTPRPEERRSPRIPGPDRELLGQAEHGHKPVHHVRFEFGAGWARGPEHPLHPQAGGKKIAEDPGS